MNWTFDIVFSPKALKDLKALDKDIQARIKAAVIRLAYFPPTCNVVKLKGGKGNLL